MRNDIMAALGKIQPQMQQELTTTISGCVQLLNEHLPKDETVHHVCSGAPTWQNFQRFSSLFAITDSRFLFVAPAPQVISFYLSELDRIQVSPMEGVSIFFIGDGRDRSYQFGIDNDYGPTFERLLDHATAVARLQNR
ncbi:hypothetical protein ACQP2K_03210 [Microbispora siamensis]